MDEGKLLTEHGDQDPRFCPVGACGAGLIVQLHRLSPETSFLFIHRKFPSAKLPVKM